MLSVVSGGFFLSNNTSEFLSATVQTTLDGSVPLSEVFFPSVVVCNINQIRKSFFAELGFYENDTLVRIMYEDFIKGTIDSERALMNEKDESYVEDPKRSAFYEVGHTQHLILFIRIFMKGMMTLYREEKVFYNSSRVIEKNVTYKSPTFHYVYTV